MEPKYGLSNGFTAMIELDTGVYRLDNWSWLRFEISDSPNPTPEVIDKLTAPVIEAVIAKAREDGDEIEYLGRQARPADTKLEGCLVFAAVGAYEVF